MAGKPAYVVDGESVRFGDVENGMRFLVSDELKSARFVCRVENEVGELEGNGGKERKERHIGGETGM